MSPIVVFFWLMLIASVVAMLAQRGRVPYASALVVVGFLLGLPWLHQQGLLPQAQFDPHLVLPVLLPPLLFEAALNLRFKHFRNLWKPIGLYALVGTLISALVVGVLAAWVLGVPLPIGLVFGALMAPTDPVSVIAVFRRLHVSPRLSLIVESESLFNDGVAAVLFAVFVSAAATGHFNAGAGALQFLLGIVGGTAVGAAFGALASRVTRAFDDHLLEITLTTVVAYGAFLSAEALHTSGVVAVVAAGLVVGNYGMRTSMSPTTRLAVTSFWEYAAFAVNSIVFLLIGLAEARVVLAWPAWGMVASAVGLVLLGRAVAVYGLAPLANLMKAELTWGDQHILFWGGLRGALSMALALGLPADFPHRETLVALVFMVVLFSLLAQALTLDPLLRRLGMAHGQKS